MFIPLRVDLLFCYLQYFVIGNFFIGMNFFLHSLIAKVVFNCSGTICAARRTSCMFFAKFPPIKQLHVENTATSEK
jgi:hypothetical protein